MPDIQPWHLNWLTNIEYDRVDLVGEGANSQAFIKIAKNRGGQNPMNLEEILKSMKPEHRTVVEAAIAKAKTEQDGKVKELEDEVAKLKEQEAPAGEQSEEEILKSIKDPGMRKLMESSIMKAKAAEAEITKMRAERAEQEAIAKAKEVPNLGTDETTITEVYKKLKGLDGSVAEEVFGIFKAASNVIAEGGSKIFTEVGKSNKNNPVGNVDAAWSAIEGKATEIAKSRNVTKENAISIVMNEHPEMYEDYLRAQQG